MEDDRRARDALDLRVSVRRGAGVVLHPDSKGDEVGRGGRWDEGCLVRRELGRERRLREITVGGLSRRESSEQREERSGSDHCRVDNRRESVL